MEGLIPATIGDALFGSVVLAGVEADRDGGWHRGDEGGRRTRN